MSCPKNSLFLHLFKLNGDKNEKNIYININYYHILYLFCTKRNCWFLDGNVEIMGSQLIIKAKYFEENNTISGKLDIPQQMAFDLKLNNFSFENEKLSFELFLNQTNVARFSGKYSQDSIIGNFIQSGVKGTFFLARNENEESGTIFLPVNYNEEEVAFYNDTIKLAGTLSFPKGKGPFPAVILVTGSGQQNRDEEVAGFKVFALIANYLSNTGFAVLRYDDRGMGGSDAGDLENSTTRTFADDAFAAFQFLQKRKK